MVGAMLMRRGPGLSSASSSEHYSSVLAHLPLSIPVDLPQQESLLVVVLLVAAYQLEFLSSLDYPRRFLRLISFGRYSPPDGPQRLP